MENVKCQGKIREKSGNFEVDDKWQPCRALLPGLQHSVADNIKATTGDQRSV